MFGKQCTRSVVLQSAGLLPLDVTAHVVATIGSCNPFHYWNNDRPLPLPPWYFDNGDPSVAIVTAEILANARRDNVIEKVSSMLTVQQGVTQVRWRVTGEQHED